MTPDMQWQDGLLESTSEQDQALAQRMAEEMARTLDARAATLQDTQKQGPFSVEAFSRDDGMPLWMMVAAAPTDQVLAVTRAYTGHTPGVAFLVVSAEAWFVKMDRREGETDEQYATRVEQSPRPSHHPDRVEVMQALAFDDDKLVVFTALPMLRDQDGRFTGLGEADPPLEATPPPGSPPMESHGRLLSGLRGWDKPPICAEHLPLAVELLGDQMKFYRREDMEQALREELENAN